MADRLKLHEELVDILGSRNVYYQPPESVKLKYPCIIYERSNNDTIYADNFPYRIIKQYTVTVIDRDPDSKISDKISKMQMCRLDRHFVVENLYHDVFTIYY